MSTSSPVKDPGGPSTETPAAAAPQPEPEASPNPLTTPIAKSDTPPADLKETPVAATPASKETPVAATPASKETPVAASSVPSIPPPSIQHDVIIPSYSRWFSWNNIHDCEKRFLPEFFDGRSPSKNPKLYKYYRNSIVRAFRENPTIKITFTEVRKTIVGDVGSIRRLFDFLEGWGLINYSGTALKQPLKWEEKESKSSQEGSSLESSVPNRVASKKLCSGCKSLCNIACFACDKYDLTLCARCYVRGNYRVGVNSSDFRRVEISEDAKTNWTDVETLRLLEAIMHHGDNWKKVAEHVGGRSEKDCVARFIKLPFGEQFVGDAESAEVYNNFYQMKDQSETESGLETIGKSSPTKRMRLTPLADASNPIMAQAAFLSALAGEEVAKAATKAAVTALSEATSRENLHSIANDSRQQEADAASNLETTVLERTHADANSLHKKEELEVERKISDIVEVKMKEIWDKIVHFEELDLQMEKEWQQLQNLRNLLFGDQLTLLFHKSGVPKTGEPGREENVRTD
ncbi:SWI/SNF complex subunit SWI3B isoform X2 [Malania oleifera]|uniref:SWI/SNF complex subunit SWI3B isoform X2 n=1 Tax=Malania oleifera TaxID=397392 RepID=UPI0025AE3D94|nr:SWI/SNF complex subunit SWI3B isoform X2 [Malania oleifera]